MLPFGEALMGVLIQQGVFFLFASLLLVASTVTVLARSPVRSALFLVLAFFSAAGLWILLEAEFLGLILILVYVGAVMTLFLFVIMTLNIDTAEKKHRFVPHAPYVFMSVVVLFGFLVYALLQNTGPVPATPAIPSEVSNTQLLGDRIYTDYAYPFEIVGVLLLVAIISVTALQIKEKRLNKSILPKKQLSAKKEDRLRIIKIPSGKKT